MSLTTLENTIIPKDIEKSLEQKYINVYNDGDDVVINYSLQIGKYYAVLNLLTVYMY